MDILNTFVTTSCVVAFGVVLGVGVLLHVRNHIKNLDEITKLRVKEILEPEENDNNEDHGNDSSDLSV